MLTKSRARFSSFLILKVLEAAKWPAAFVSSALSPFVLVRYETAAEDQERFMALLKETYGKYDDVNLQERSQIPGQVPHHLRYWQ
jgi:hypothetical protein